VSRDGNVVVGFSQFSSLSGTLEAFRWTPSAGMQALSPPVNPPFLDTDATAVSGNGAVIVGSGTPAGGGAVHPWRWTEAGGMADLGLAAGAMDGVANMSNLDGSVLLATMRFSGGQYTPYVWLSYSGFVPFTDYLAGNGVTLPVGYSSYNVTSLSDDGRTFGGYVFGAGIATAFVTTIPAPGAGAGSMAALLFLTRRSRRRVWTNT